MTPRRVVLVGFMASGKTAVGGALAARLGWRHVDVDRQIEIEAGCSIEEIFTVRGEAEFRALEIRTTPKLMQLERAVISTGGGWVTNPGSFSSLPPDTLSVWLKVSPDEVLRRLASSAAQPVRPLLSGSNPRRRIEELIIAREPLYGLARVTMDTENRSVHEIAERLEQIVRSGPTAFSPSDSTTQHDT